MADLPGDMLRPLAERERREGGEDSLGEGLGTRIPATPTPTAASEGYSTLLGVICQKRQFPATSLLTHGYTIRWIYLEKPCYNKQLIENTVLLPHCLSHRGSEGMHRRPAEKPPPPPAAEPGLPAVAEAVALPSKRRGREGANAHGNVDMAARTHRIF